MSLRRGFRHFLNVVYVLFNLFLLLCIMFLFDGYSAQLPFKMVLTVLFIQVILFYVSFLRVRVSLYSKNGDMIKKDSGEIVINVAKHGFYPFKKIEFDLKYKNQFEKEYSVKKYVIELGDGKSADEIVKIDDLKCGINEVHIENAVIYDMFGFANVLLGKKRHKGKAEFVVMPKIIDVPIDISLLRYMTEEEAMDYFTDEENEFSDYNIREFRDGDKLNKIHWKLSSKSDEIMVLSDASSSEPFAYVFTDFESDENIYEMLDRCYSECYKLANLSFSHYLAWKGRNGGMKRKLIVDLKTLDDTVIQIMTETKE